MQDAAKLAENSAIFEAIYPDMDITQATDGLVSIIKAYDLDVEDSLDGIISKVNEVGNKFAVSNGDIVEAMTRSSAAMAAANNTFEETVALATAAIEITRDAATVGNGLKTLSMRIRGYDEETEEYSADVSELTGTIADLTKVASNNNRGISLFEADDPETYRSTYDILSDIARRSQHGPGHYMREMPDPAPRPYDRPVVYERRGVDERFTHGICFRYRQNSGIRHPPHAPPRRRSVRCPSEATAPPPAASRHGASRGRRCRRRGMRAVRTGFRDNRPWRVCPPWRVRPGVRRGRPEAP